jgi:hypothetical protein
LAEQMLMITPRPAVSMRGSALRVARTAAIRFNVRQACQSSSVIDRNPPGRAGALPTLLTTDSARRGRRLLLAAEHAFGLGRADLVEQLLTRASRTNLSRLERARMEWLREIFSDGMPGDAGRVLELCDIALESAGAGDADLSHSRTPIAAPSFAVR